MTLHNAIYEKSGIFRVLDFYGFSAIPFGKNIPNYDLFLSSGMRDAQSMLEMGVASEDILMVTGPIGCGKSAALRYFMYTLDPNAYLPVYMTGNINSPSEFYKRVLQALLINPPFSPIKTKAVYFKSISDMSKKPVVVVDDAEVFAGFGYFKR